MTERAGASVMKPLIWSLVAVLGLGWTGVVWLTHQLSGWLLGAADAGALKGAGTAVAELALPPLPAWAAPWFDAAWLAEWQTLGASLLAWLGGVWPSGEALMAWVGPLLWLAWALGWVILLALGGLAHWFSGRGHYSAFARQAGRP